MMHLFVQTSMSVRRSGRHEVLIGPDRLRTGYLPFAGEIIRSWHGVRNGKSQRELVDWRVVEPLDSVGNVGEIDRVGAKEAVEPMD